MNQGAPSSRSRRTPSDHGELGPWPSALHERQFDIDKAVVARRHIGPMAGAAATAATAGAPR